VELGMTPAARSRVSTLVTPVNVTIRRFAHEMSDDELEAIAFGGKRPALPALVS
jgi:hypothetical protein